MRKIYLCVLFTLFSLSLSAYKDPVSGVEYETNSDGTAKVARDNIGRKLKTPNIVILSSFSEGEKDYIVTEISASAFGADLYAIAGGGDYYITSVQIPETVTKIGGGAFACLYNLTSINLPSNLTKIEPSTFSDCKSITSIRIPEGVKEIGGGAFANTGIKKIVIPNSVERIGLHAFSGCKNLEDVTLPTGLKIIAEGLFENSGLIQINIPSSVTEIQTDAFYGCQLLTSIEMPKKLTKIGYEVFHGCESLTSLLIPENVQTIGNGIVNGCKSLKSIHVDVGNITYDSRDDCNAIIETASNTFKIGCMASQIPNTVESIGKYAFLGCTSLKEIIIPGNVKCIEDYAFQFCENLLKVKIEEGVEKIGDYSFRNCNNLNTLVLPSTTLQIGNEAFSYCKLESVTSYIKKPFELPQGTFITTWTREKLDDGSIKECVSYDVDATLYVPVGTKGLYETTMGWNRFKKIEELSGESGINSIIQGHDSVDNTYYSLGGVRINKPLKGLYIKKGRKTFIKR